MRQFFLGFIFALVTFHGDVQAYPFEMGKYQQGQWPSLLRENRGHPFVVHFWGVSCAPCVREMPNWGEFSRVNPSAHLIFIQVDDVSTSQISTWLEKHRFGDNLAQKNRIQMMTLADAFDEFIWYEVDRRWHGETPMTMLIDANGKTTMKLGYIDFNQVTKFFKQ